MSKVSSSICRTKQGMHSKSMKTRRADCHFDTKMIIKLGTKQLD